MDFPQFSSVRAKLGVAFGALALLVLVAAAVSVKGLSDANQRFERFTQSINARAMLAMRIRQAVDDRALAARNLVLARKGADREEELRRVERAHAVVGERVARLRQMASAPDVPDEARRLVADIDRVEQRYGPVAQAIVDLAVKGQTEAAIAKINDECRPLLDQLVGAALAYQQLADRREEELIQQSHDEYARQRLWLLLACAVALGAAILAGWQIACSLMRALGAEPAQLGAAAEQVARGDLRPVRGVEGAHGGSVLASLAEMQGNLASIVQQVREASDSIATGSAEIASGNADLSQRTEEQASALQQTAATMDELASTVRSNADNAQQANQLAREASRVAAEGGAEVGAVVATMKAIETSSRRIEDIIGVIDGIAFQTNILALNAAVEAARAGELGRGFAVVAGEVRTLAQRSAGAAHEIKALIHSSVAQVAQGSELADRAGQTMGEVVAAIQRVSDIVAEISVASAEQSEGVGQVGQAVAQMDQVTQQNAALVEQSASAAESLKAQAGQLVQTVAAFSLR
ncbi:MAG: methyl-accepting chemotaxis protein [Roseateles depolymerans]|uniref:Methyl-accepting chemotaxis protein n=1 Tax=Roseateles depolymerans TaxID=76731 RepID=A0A2W5FXW6_9BURK|nr:MAG: methyl-accepting chemotaxis protein [Roseateles depolymerans]